MVTVFRAHGLRLVISPDDHEPAHGHVYVDGETKMARRDWFLLWA
jgi:hypothetical protein